MKLAIGLCILASSVQAKKRTESVLVCKFHPWYFFTAVTTLICPSIILLLDDDYDYDYGTNDTSEYQEYDPMADVLDARGLIMGDAGGSRAKVSFFYYVFTVILRGKNTEIYTV